MGIICLLGHRETSLQIKTFKVNICIRVSVVDADGYQFREQTDNG